MIGINPVMSSIIVIAPAVKRLPEKGPISTPLPELISYLLKEYRQLSSFEEKKKFIERQTAQFTMALFDYFMEELKKIDPGKFKADLQKALPAIERILQSEIPDVELVQEIVEFLDILLSIREEMARQAEQYPELAEEFFEHYMRFVLALILSVESYRMDKNPEDLQVLEYFYDDSDVALDRFMLKEYLDAVGELVKTLSKYERKDDERIQPL